MRKLLTFLIVLVVLLIGADFALRFIATRQIGEAIQTRLDLPTAPAVSISGFPFVTQAINGQYDAISGALAPTTFGPVSNVGVSIDLLGVRIPLRDALAGDVNALTADSSQVRVTIPTSSIATAVGVPSLQVSSQAGVLTVTATLSVAGQQFPLTAGLAATVADNQLTLRTGEVTGLGVTIPAEVVQTVGTLVDLAVPLTGLPFVISRGSVNVVGGDLVVDATTTALDFATR